VRIIKYSVVWWKLSKHKQTEFAGKLKDSVFVKTAGHHISEIICDCPQHKPGSIAVYNINEDNYSWLTPLVL
jgi:hypothetical protein